MPRVQRFTLGLTVLNLCLFVLLLLSQASPAMGRQSSLMVLRGRALEIVDDRGRIRANILVHGPETVGGITYPETVLFRLADPQGGPVVRYFGRSQGAGEAT